MGRGSWAAAPTPAPLILIGMKPSDKPRAVGVITPCCCFQRMRRPGWAQPLPLLDACDPPPPPLVASFPQPGPVRPRGFCSLSSSEMPSVGTNCTSPGILMARAHKPLALLRCYDESVNLRQCQLSRRHFIPNSALALRGHRTTLWFAAHRLPPGCSAPPAAQQDPPAAAVRTMSQGDRRDDGGSQAASAVCRVQGGRFPHTP